MDSHKLCKVSIVIFKTGVSGVISVEHSCQDHKGGYRRSSVGDSRWMPLQVSSKLRQSIKEAMNRGDDE